MKIQSIVLFLCLSIANISVQTFEPPQKPIVLKPKAKLAPALPKGSINLISAEGGRFPIPAEALSYLGTIQSLRGGVFEEAAASEIQIPEISNQTLDEVTRILKIVQNRVYPGNSLQVPHLMEDIEKEVPITDAFKLFKVADFLDFDLLKKFVAYTLAKRVATNSMSYEQFNQQLKQVSFLTAEMKRALLLEVARNYYFIRFRNNMKSFDLTQKGYSWGRFQRGKRRDLFLGERQIAENEYTYPAGLSPQDYHLSIQDYLDNAIAYVVAHTYSNYQGPVTDVELGGIWLVSLDGVQNLPRSNDINFFEVYGNLLTTIVPEDFTNLRHLRVLGLTKNKISSVPAHAFARLSNLFVLSLARNEISTIDPQALFGLNSLTEIYLDSNRLTHLPAGLFSQTPLIRRIDLQNNPLEKLDPALLMGLAHLELVVLTNTRLSRAAADLLRARFPDVRFEFRLS